ncbi:MAG: hypothetical protein NTW87_31770, partial [Planctomycetota bacterium]|nr:hypothetical protein [Planctomycetota bacterium]
VEVVANGSGENYRHQSRAYGDLLLPPYGFAVESRSFVAFCALSFNGVGYATPTLFALRSLDGKPLDGSGQVRIFHGFGDSKLKLGGAELTVEKETVVSGGAR